MKNRDLLRNRILFTFSTKIVGSFVSREGRAQLKDEILEFFARPPPMNLLSCPRVRGPRIRPTRWNFSTLFSRPCVKFHSPPSPPPPSLSTYVSPRRSSSPSTSSSPLANSRDIHPSVRLAPFCEQSGRQDKYGKRGAGRSAPPPRRRGFRNNMIISRNPPPAVPARNRYLSRIPMKRV